MYTPELMASRLTLSVCGFVCLCVCVVYGASCGTYTASDGVSKYYLAPLSTTSDYSGREDQNPNFAYLWNFCQNLNTSLCDRPPSPVVQHSAENNDCYPTGYLPAKLSDHPAGPTKGVVIQYVNDHDFFCRAGTVPRTTIIKLTCDLSTLYKLTSITEPADSFCKYVIQISSSIACPLPKF